MTDREKLIELIRQGKDMTPCEKDNDYRCEGIKCADCESKSIADYLLANGVVVPPLSLNQMVWCKSFDGINQCKVSSLTQKADGSFKIRLTHSRYRSVFEITPDRIGEDIFLTKEEAEAELKKRGKENA